MPRRTYVALDLETTGLDPDRDAIIEVGATRFDLDGNEETFRTFCDPKRPIPYRVQRLTGISESDTHGAPLFAEVAGELQEFIGDSPLVGQNIGFDLSFLARAQLRPAGPAYDTQDLATLLLPDLVERNLRGIANHLGMEFVAHRALEDAEAARFVFAQLRERLAWLPPALLAEASRAAAATDLPLRFLLREVLDELPTVAASNGDGLVHGAVRPPPSYGTALQPVGDGRELIDVESIGRALGESARFALEGFEEREEQIAMARAVTTVLNSSGQILIEAGTGIGKSLAYLLPSASYAMANNGRVVISTNTINLQEQLLSQDVPKARQVLPDGANLHAAQLKGRRNYLCLQRWSNLREASNVTPDEANLLVRLLLWLPNTETGDRSELRLNAGEDAVWNRMSAQDGACLSTPCPFVRDGSCFLLRARKRAEAAHVVLVNHALLLSDVVVGGGVIPEYQHLVIDEAHHLEAEATRRFGFETSEDHIDTLLGRLSVPNGGLTERARNAMRTGGGPDASEAAALSRVEHAVEGTRQILPEFFLRLEGFMRQQSNADGEYEGRLRLNHAMRIQPDWTDIETTWERVGASMGALLAGLDQLAARLAGLPGLAEHQELPNEALELFQELSHIRAAVGAMILQDDSSTISWLTQQRNGSGLQLASAPLRVAEILDERLFSQKDAAVLTSATLTVENRFDYVRNALGLGEAEELRLGSPFDYATSTTVLLPLDMPEPNDPNYMLALQQAIIELARASSGRALVLFTSHSSLRAAHHGIKKPLEEEEILVLGQNVDGSPKQLIQALKQNPRTVLLGAASFWEGIDVVGDALSLLIIARLPFSVPDDPVFQARSELYDDPFGEYALPQAVLRFKQGFGRLIRRKTDRGAMVMLDGRIHSKQYGQSFLRSLPPCSIQRLSTRQMGGVVSQWLANRPEGSD
jgi:DNA polymerase-3 subunit epsilon/ATP-dependent DNA helicase DinG